MSGSGHELYGMYGSPYTRKVEAAMRYARIPFTKHPLMPGNIKGDWEPLGFGNIKPKVIPVVKYPDGVTQNDSTYILQKLDLENQNRPLTPTNAGDRFISLLLEDMFDEWLVKIMFGMRWLEEVDQEWSGAWILYDAMLGQGEPLENVKETGKMFGNRQVSRMKIVGCEDPVLVTRSLREIMSILETHLHTGSMFLLGRPTVADFALYGQASQLVVDRTPDHILRTEFPACWAWVRAMEDQSGHQGKDTEVSEGAKNMLGFASQVYLPFLAANRAALAAGQGEVHVGLWGGEVDHRQPVFKYQDKCYKVLQEEFNKLEGEDKQRCKDILQGAGCLQYFQ